jgi:hypothetical protein
VESLERLLLVMGERMRLETEQIGDGERDRDWEEIHRARPMAERLERAFDAATFADQLHGTVESA